MAAQQMPVRAPAAQPASRGRAEGNRGGPLKSAAVAPAVIGGAFTAMTAYFPSMVVTTGVGGRLNQAGYVGSGSPYVTNGWYVSDGSATGVSETWALLEFSEDQKRDIWSFGARDFALGSCEPHPGIENQFVEDAAGPPPAPVPVDYIAYYNNDFEAGLVGPSQTALRYSGNWVSIQNQPAPGTTDLTAVKCYPANQVSFIYPAGPAISAFKTIKGYANVVNPPGDDNVIYEAAWDIYGFAHWDRNGGNTSLPFISFECMFWTYNHGQDPYIGPLVETGVDLDDGRGPVWDLFMIPDTAATGGINDRYSYGIFYLQDAYQTPADATWVNILAGIRYFAQHYVVPTGGAPADPLNTPLYQVTRGWEVCSTFFQPLPFQMLDYRLVME